MRNHNRARVRAIVQLMPGIHLRQLQRAMGTSFSTVRYHAEALSRNGEVLDERDGKYRRLYPHDISGEEKAFFTVIRTSSNARVLKVLVRSPSLTNKQVANATGLAESTVNRTLSNLVDQRIVRRSSSRENKVAYELQDADKIQNLIKRTNRAVEKAIDRYLDLWEF